MGRQLGGGTRRQVIEPKPVHLRVIMYRLKSLVRVFPLRICGRFYLRRRREHFLCISVCVCVCVRVS